MDHTSKNGHDFTVLDLNASGLSKLAGKLYIRTKARWRLLQQLRPYICPFPDLVALVPLGAKVLDVGCGAGLFLLILSKLNRVKQADGFDVSSEAIAAAKTAAESARLHLLPRFHVRSIEEGVPSGDWSLITVLDVLHHIPPGSQQAFVHQLADAVPAGGQLLIKDMVDRPNWRAAANRLHDLLIAKQWVHHRDPSDVETWLSQRGLICSHRSRKNMLWYGHWALVFDRPSRHE